MSDAVAFRDERFVTLRNVQDASDFPKKLPTAVAWSLQNCHFTTDFFSRRQIPKLLVRKMSDCSGGAFS